MMRNSICLLSLAAAVILTISGRSSAVPLPVPTVTTMRTPDGGIQPQVIVDRGIVHLISFKGDPKAGDVYYTRSTDGGRMFSTPIRVNSQEGTAIAIGNIRGPQFAVGKNGRVHVAWNGANGSGVRGAPMYYSRMNDAGTGFEPQRNLMQMTYGLDGGGSVAADGAGNVYVAWHGGGNGSSGEAQRRVWIARSRDEGKTFSREAPAWNQPTGACGCCGLKAFADSSGDVFILYRAATQSVNRDMYLLMSKDRGRTFEGDKVHTWKINACPMSSSSLIQDRSAVLLAWETKGQVYWGAADPVTFRVTQPIAAPGEGGRRQHPVLAVNSRGEVLMAWTEGVTWDRGGSAAWQVYNRNGQPLPGGNGTAEGVPTWSLVAAFARPDGSFVVVR